MFKERFLVNFGPNDLEKNVVIPENVDKVGPVKNILDQLRTGFAENVSSGAMEDNSTPYRNELINCLSSFKNESVKGVKHTGTGLEIGFLNGTSAKIEGDAYTALYWQEISANTLNLLKKPSFTKTDLAIALVTKDAEVTKLVDGVKQAHIKNGAAKEIIETRTGTAKEFENAVRTAFEDLKQIYGNDEDFWKAWDERKIYDALRKQIEKTITPEKFASLTPGAVKVRLELPHRKKDKPGSPTYIYVVNTREGSHIGVEILESERQVLNEEYGRREISGNVPDEKLDKNTEKMKAEAAKELKQEIQNSWTHFKNLEAHRSDLYWDCTSKSKRGAISEKFAEVLKINIRNNSKLQEGMRLLTGREDELKGINLRLPGTDHIIDVSYVVSGVDTPGLRFTWSGELVSNELYFYPVMAIGALSKVESAYTPDSDTLNKATDNLRKLTPEKQRVTLGTSQSLQDMRAGMEITADTERAQSYNESLPPPNDAFAKVSSIDNWEVNMALSEGKASPDLWAPNTADGRGTMRKEWIALGLPAQHGNSYFDSIFNQLRKCTDSEFLKNKSDEVKAWYANPHPNLEKIGALKDAAFCSAWSAYEGMKKSIKSQALYVQSKADSLRNEDREPVLDTVTNFASQGYKDFGRAMKNHDYGALAAYGVCAYFAYEAIKWLWSSSKDEAGFAGGLKKVIKYGALLYGGAYVARRNGYPQLYNFITLKSATDSTSKDNPMMKPLLKIVPQAGRSPAEDGINENIYMRLSQAKMARLQELYRNSKGNREFIDPKEFRDIFKEFEGASGSTLESKRDMNYLNTGKQLFLIAKYINIAYQKTLYADPNNKKYHQRDLSDVLGEYPHKYSDVADFVAALKPTKTQP